jgi:plastocyanin
MRRVLILPALLATAGLLLAGCGGGGGGSTTGGGGSSAPATSGAPSGGGAVAVTMKNIAFSPRVVRARVGQTITWTNDDTVTHNVIATSGASFRSNDFGQGGTFSFTPTRAGVIAYVCTIHPGMDGSVVVTR